MERELRFARRTLVAVVAARTIAIAAAAGGAMLLMLVLIDALVTLPLAWLQGGRVVAAGAAMVAAVLVVAGARGVARLEGVALWLEERDPRLRYAVVTAIDPSTPPESRALLGSSIPAGSLRDIARRGALTALVRPAAIAAITLGAVLAVTRGSVARVVDIASDGSPPATLSARGADRIGRVLVEITPPAYAGGRRATLEDPAVVQALPGSRLRISVRGRGTRATVGERELDAPESGGRFELTMPRSAAVLRLRAAGDQRLVTLEPTIDESPSVRLTQPQRDSVLREPRGSISLEAEALDDHGLRDGAFEWILSSGEGENYTFRSGRVGWWRADGRSQRFAARLSLDSLRLSPGDVLHMRAVARDGNDVTGPSVGSSETRAFRVPRRGEYDSVAVEGAPPGDVDNSALSQRMLIQMAEGLERRRPRLDRPTLIRESTRISADQKRLRRNVGDVIFMRLGGEASGEHSHDDGHDHGDSAEELLEMAREAAERDPEAVLDFEGDETPVVAVNRPLLRAYNAMWAASMELDQGSPATALPHMREALEALQEARMAERIYLRGRPPTVIVDLDRVRLQGTARGTGTSRQPHEAPARALQAMVRRLESALAFARQDANTASDTLLMLRLELVGDNAPAAEALLDAATSLRRGDAQGAARSLARARGAILGAPRRQGGIGRWIGEGGW
jgi:hypothetical protein